MTGRDKKSPAILLYEQRKRPRPSGKTGRALSGYGKKKNW
jgi:hypothetical protein